MVRGGFSPVERNLLSASSTEAVAQRRRYECRGAEVAAIRPGLRGPRGPAAADRRRRPTAPTRKKEGDSTFTIEVPQAAAGKWHYTVTPVEVPYPNFPFSLTVGEK